MNGFDAVNYDETEDDGGKSSTHRLRSTNEALIRYDNKSLTDADGNVATEQVLKVRVINEKLPEQELKLKKYDISLTVGYAAQLLLDCDLDPSQVSWTSEHPFIATVDETGLVKAVSYGTTAIIVKYGDQEVQCIVRCK